MLWFSNSDDASALKYLESKGLKFTLRLYFDMSQDTLPYNEHPKQRGRAKPQGAKEVEWN